MNMGHFSSKTERTLENESLRQAIPSLSPQHSVVLPPAPKIFDITPPKSQHQNFLGQSYESDEDAEMIQFVALLAVRGLPAVLPEPQRVHPQARQPALSTTLQSQSPATRVNFSRPIQPGSSLSTTTPTSPPQISQPETRSRRSQYVRDPSYSTPRTPRLSTTDPEPVTGFSSNVKYCHSATNSYAKLARDGRGRVVQVANLEEKLILSPPNPSSTTLQECIVCVEDKPLTSFPKATSKCKHASTTCLACTRQWISSELNAMTWDRLQCTAQGCNAILQHDDVKRIAKRSVFEKYDQFVTLSLISTLPDFYWCLSPCGSGQIHLAGISGPIFTCVSCGYRSCVVHNVPWHTNLTCREYDYAANPALKKQEEMASEKAVRDLARKCPGTGCGAPIIRNGGCDHMTCKRCGWEFCWLCFADYNEIRKKGNAAHQTSCRLHTRNLP